MIHNLLHQLEDYLPSAMEANTTRISHKSRNTYFCSMVNATYTNLEATQICTHQFISEIDSFNWPVSQHSEKAVN